MAPHKIIIDTDPGEFAFQDHNAGKLYTDAMTGVDDMVGLLLALSATPEELDILLISVTYGNVPLKKSVILPISPLVHVADFAPAHSRTLLPFSTCLRKSWNGESLSAVLWAMRPCAKASRSLPLGQSIP